jgi:hypothetical protein
LIWRITATASRRCIWRTDWLFARPRRGGDEGRCGRGGPDRHLWPSAQNSLVPAGFAGCAGAPPGSIFPLHATRLNADSVALAKICGRRPDAGQPGARATAATPSPRSAASNGQGGGGAGLGAGAGQSRCRGLFADAAGRLSLAAEASWAGPGGGHAEALGRTYWSGWALVCSAPGSRRAAAAGFSAGGAGGRGPAAGAAPRPRRPRRPGAGRPWPGAGGRQVRPGRR